MAQRSRIVARDWQGALLIGLGVLLTMNTIRTAWLCDDAFITFRVVDNFLNGFGLRWNVTERVQVYTNPLWMLLLVAGTWISGTLISTAYVLSLVCSTVAAGVGLLALAGNPGGQIFFLCSLLSSRSWVDFTSSGLENPLGFLLTATFAFLVLNASERKWCRIGAFFLAGFFLVHRIDSLLVILPALIWLVWQEHRSSRAGLAHLMAGLIPFFFWEGFALVYYGSPVPNPVIAKMVTGYGLAPFLGPGLEYFIVGWLRDPILIGVLAMGLLAVPKVSFGSRMLLCGAGLQLSAIVFQGGDFMAGRFLAGPFFWLPWSWHRRRSCAEWA